MKTVGIIAEYNPFHKGHAYQLEKAKELAGADYAVIVLSGDFVQRGLPAVINKYLRTEMALRSGADLVLELPSCYATASAETFAQGAVSVLESLGCADALCFGSEAGDLDALLPYARLFEEEPPAYKEFLKAYLREGKSYPAARSRAAEDYRSLTERILPCCADDADCKRISSPLEEPNNALGIEYCRALLRRKSPIKPLTLRRVSSGYHDLTMDAKMASASAIRSALDLPETGTAQLKAQLPPSSFDLLKNALSSNALLRLDDFSLPFAFRLLSLSRTDLASFQDVGEDLAARIDNHRFQFTNLSEFADLLKTKQLTHTRITRALCHILLDFRQEQLLELREAGFPVYLRILGFRERASLLLAEAKKRSTLPLLAKAADASSILSGTQLALFSQDVSAAHIYETVKAQKLSAPLIHEYTRSPVIVP